MQVLHDFPTEMQGDVAMHLHREVLSLPIFDNASQGCRKAIAMQITPTFCTPGEYVLHRGDAVSGIYCVCNGSMEVLRDGMVVAILGNSRPLDALSLSSSSLLRSSRHHLPCDLYVRRCYRPL